MAEEDGNVGGWQWDLHHHHHHHSGSSSHSSHGSPSATTRRPQPGGKFPRIEDSERMPRDMREMHAEAAAYRELLGKMALEEERSAWVRKEVESVVPF